ncbi:ABC transporter substrate-binding protein [Paracraurococcus lichenis]|uniref:ABC transporter substrate-binding protein n=1 Tax=Paracraurococcus lichenis TaxID=3064888 RepID=A0ABT9E0Q8_9PROT|nr:ABC transporter substrate-binding protein [Paracraurococcus sp. LOR1-02]MDO9709726.1 ABC transporter substrate-binding protein [Paracraurococcus sp. LOR1-02]
MTRSLAILAALLWGMAAAAQPAATRDIPILYLERSIERPATLSSLDLPPTDAGLQGARLGLADAMAAGRLIGQRVTLAERVLEPGADLAEALRAALAEAMPAAILANLPAADLLRLADLPEARDLTVLNAAAPEDALRGAECRRNLLHVHPSRAMLADAVMQFAARRRWSKLFLVLGQTPEDAAWAEALRLAARKFNQRIVGEKRFGTDGADLRDTAAAEMPVLTQGPDYDMVLVADAWKDFARFVPYNTWLPRPVAGSAGLEPVAWSPAAEQWGATQLQNRFERQAGRPMTGIDWSAWAAMRAVAQAATAAGSAEPARVGAALRAPGFSFAGFKGRPLSFRPWDGQLRQPIQLAMPGAVVAVAPLEGYLHRRTELDTLGPDEPETACRR